MLRGEPGGSLKGGEVPMRTSAGEAQRSKTLMMRMATRGLNRNVPTLRCQRACLLCTSSECKSQPCQIPLLIYLSASFTEATTRLWFSVMESLSRNHPGTFLLFHVMSLVHQRYPPPNYLE